MRVVEDISYGPLDAQMLDLFLPEKTPCDLVVWFHGGGMDHGSHKEHPFMEQLVEKGVAVASVCYRMYPDVEFPAFIEDAALSVAYMQKVRAEYGASGRLFVSGASAGAYLTVMLCLCPEYLKKVGVDPMSIDGFISESSQMTTHFRVLQQRGLDKRLERIDEAAPLFYISADTRFTRLLLIAYEDDMKCRLEQNLLAYQSILRFNPETDVQFVRLPGKHVHGSKHPNEDGSFDFVRVLCEFISL